MRNHLSQPAKRTRVFFKLSLLSTLSSILHRKIVEGEKHPSSTRLALKWFSNSLKAFGIVKISNLKDLTVRFPQSQVKVFEQFHRKNLSNAPVSDFPRLSS